jgi:hypothetical protein
MKMGLIMKASDVGRRLALSMVLAISGVAHGQQSGTTDSSYLPVVVKEAPAAVQKRMEAAKPEIMQRQLDLLHDHYDLSDRPAVGVTIGSTHLAPDIRP